MGDAPPESVGRYRIQRQIGRGMMGVVYEALDPDLDRTVAVKTISLAFPVSKGERETFEERFFVEARIAARLSHPGIVIVHDVGRDPAGGTLFLVLERLEGRTLAEVIAQREPVPWREALRLIASVAEALDHAHRQGIVHRDMKPANVMVLPSGQPKIMDFGIAKIADAHGALTLAGQFLGTPLYMAPEQALGKEVDGRADIFSLGSILYALLTGREAFEAESVPRVLSRVAHEDPPPPSTLVGEIPTDVDALVLRAMAKDPSARYPEARLLALDLADVGAGQRPRHLADPVRPTPAPGPPAAPADPGTAGIETLDLSAHGPVGLETEPSPPHGLTRGLFGAVFVLLTLLALLRVPRQEGGRGGSAPSPDVAAPAGHAVASPEPGATAEARATDLSALALEVEHSLRSGTLNVWVDGDLALTEHLAARVQRKILFVTLRKGVLQKEVEVSPGEHRIRVAIRWSDGEETDQVSGTFRPGMTRRLHVSVGRLFKGLTLDWR